MCEFNSSASNSKPYAQKSNHNRIPKRITSDYLHNAGLFYLQRFATSVPNFERVMRSKVYKSCRYRTDQDESTCVAMVKALIEKFIRSGLLNDDLYGQGLVATLKKRGFPDRYILQKLQAKGIRLDIACQLLSDYAMANRITAEESEFNAALAFCRRKKLGSFSLDKPDPGVFQKQLSKMARAGFSYEVSLKALSLDIHDDPRSDL